MFDLKRASELKDQALCRVETPVRSWVEIALPVIAEIAHDVDEFTTDRVEWQLQRHGIPSPREKRAMGALMRKAALAGYILNTNRTSASIMPSNHRRPKTIWKSLLRGSS
mgnify:CR=1 FL=1